MGDETQHLHHGVHLGDGGVHETDVDELHHDSPHPLGVEGEDPYEPHPHNPHHHHHDPEEDAAVAMDVEEAVGAGGVDDDDDDGANGDVNDGEDGNGEGGGSVVDVMAAKDEVAGNATDVVAAPVSVATIANVQSPPPPPQPLVATAPTVMATPTNVLQQQPRHQQPHHQQHAQHRQQVSQPPPQQQQQQQQQQQATGTITKQEEENNHSASTAEGDRGEDFFDHDPDVEERRQLRKAAKRPSEWLKLLCRDWAMENLALLDQVDAKFMQYKPYLRGNLSSQLLCKLSLLPVPIPTPTSFAGAGDAHSNNTGHLLPNGVDRDGNVCNLQPASSTGTPAHGVAAATGQSSTAHPLEKTLSPEAYHRSSPVDFWHMMGITDEFDKAYIVTQMERFNLLYHIRIPEIATPPSALMPPQASEPQQRLERDTMPVSVMELEPSTLTRESPGLSPAPVAAATKAGTMPSNTMDIPTPPPPSHTVNTADGSTVVTDHLDAHGNSAVAPDAPMPTTAIDMPPPTLDSEHHHIHNPQGHSPMMNHTYGQAQPSQSTHEQHVQYSHHNPHAHSHSHPHAHQSAVAATDPSTVATAAAAAVAASTVDHLFVSDDATTAAAAAAAGIAANAGMYSIDQTAVAAASTVDIQKVTKKQIELAAAVAATGGVDASNVDIEKAAIAAQQVHSPSNPTPQMMPTHVPLQTATANDQTHGHAQVHPQAYNHLHAQVQLVAHHPQAAHGGTLHHQQLPGVVHGTGERGLDQDRKMHIKREQRRLTQERKEQKAREREKIAIQKAAERMRRENSREERRRKKLEIRVQREKFAQEQKEAALQRCAELVASNRVPIEITRGATAAKAAANAALLAGGASAMNSEPPNPPKKQRSAIIVSTAGDLHAIVTHSKNLWAKYNAIAKEHNQKVNWSTVAKELGIHVKVREKYARMHSRAEQRGFDWKLNHDWKIKDHPDVFLEPTQAEQRAKMPPMQRDTRTTEIIDPHKLIPGVGLDVGMGLEASASPTTTAVAVAAAASVLHHHHQQQQQSQQHQPQPHHEPQHPPPPELQPQQSHHQQQQQSLPQPHQPQPPLPQPHQQHHEQTATAPVRTAEEQAAAAVAAAEVVDAAGVATAHTTAPGVPSSEIHMQVPVPTMVPAEALAQPHQQQQNHHHHHHQPQQHQQPPLMHPAMEDPAVAQAPGISPTLVADPTTGYTPPSMEIASPPMKM